MKRKVTTFLSALALFAAMAIASGGESTTQLAIKVDGLACPFCARGLEKHLKKVKAVESVTLSLKTGEAIIQVRPNQTAPVKDLREAIRRGGFTPGAIKMTAAGSVSEEKGRLLLLVRGTKEKYLLFEDSNRKAQAEADRTLTAKTESALRKLIQDKAVILVTGEVHEHSQDLPALRLEHYETAK
jgi:copper chaperone CopZ